MLNKHPSVKVDFHDYCAIITINTSDESYHAIMRQNSIDSKDKKHISFIFKSPANVQCLRESIDI